MNINTDIDKITLLNSEIMKLSYSLCKSDDKNTAIKASQINNKANDALKYMRSLETKLKLKGDII